MRNLKINQYRGMYMETAEEHSDAMGMFQKSVKRFFDLLFSLIGMVLFSPLFIVIWIVLLFDRGPVIFKQERIGYKEKPFYIYKFRSMRTDAESHGIPRLAEERNFYMTPFGSFLRAHHLDELPQLWNVLRGDMSFVGPRPERRYFIDQIDKVTDNYKYIYKMRPGLTSYATIYNGYTDTMEKMLKRLEYDLEYLDNRSIFFDIKIVLTTVWSIISGKKF